MFSDFEITTASMIVITNPIYSFPVASTLPFLFCKHYVILANFIAILSANINVKLITDNSEILNCCRQLALICNGQLAPILKENTEVIPKL